MASIEETSPGLAGGTREERGELVGPGDLEGEACEEADCAAALLAKKKHSALQRIRTRFKEISCEAN